MNRSELLFAFACIPLRILLALEAKKSPTWLIAVALAIAAGFMYYWITGTRKTGVETGGKPIWWNSVRPVHSMLWLGFALSALGGYTQAWKFLAVDVILGLVLFFFYK
jgi:hypothetical protein